MSSSNDYLRIARFLAQGRSIVWIRIISKRGSAPRSTGASCLLLDGKTLVGSIGGGRMEFEALKEAGRISKEQRPRIMHFNLMGQDADAAGMICGGTVDILMDSLFHDDPEVVSFFNETKNLIQNGTPGTFISLVKTAEGDLPEKGARMFVGIHGETVGNIPGVTPPPDELARIDTPGLIRCPETGRTFFVEPIEKTPALLLFGAGHISTCLAPMAKKLGFRIIIIDDRAEYANFDRFPDVDEVFAVPFERAVKQVPTNYATYIVIVTRGHIHDRLVLEAMLNKPHAYLGMIGSIHKRNAIYTALSKTGISPDALSAVHSPIGLDIGAETPEEIAVSIMAELISIRTEKRKAWMTALKEPIKS